MRTSKNNAALRKTNSATINSFLDAGGDITEIKNFNRGEGDSEYRLFTAADRVGTFIIDNSGVSWLDSGFDALVSAIEAGKEIGKASGIAKI